MTPSPRKGGAARRETVALTRDEIEDILFFEFCLDRDEARKFWDAAQDLLQAGAQ